MTRRLILIRHAKSGWDNIYADDHARTLTDSGKTSSEAIGQWLAAQGFVPDLILTSDATRALQTTTLVKKGIGHPIPTEEISMLYHASPDTIRDYAGKQTAQTVAVVGHNPGIGMAANLLVTYAPNHHRFNDYPTAATTVIDFAGDHWAEPGKGTVTAFTTPKDL